MTIRRGYSSVFALALLVAGAAFAIPVRATGFDTCGVAGLWVTGLAGDPTGPTDPPGTYAEYNACRLAARPAVAVMLCAALIAVVTGIALLRRVQRDRLTASGHQRRVLP